MNATETIWDEIGDLCGRYDAAIEIATASQCAWGGELRLTLTNPPDAPSRSITFYSVGGATPEAVGRRLLGDCRTWLRESGVVPLPVPDW